MTASPYSLDRVLWLVRRSYLETQIEAARGNMSRAARLAGRNRTDFYKLCRKAGVDFQAMRQSRFGARPGRKVPGKAARARAAERAEVMRWMRVVTGAARGDQ